MLELYDVVQLREAMPGDLPAGAVGAVVDVLDGSPPLYEVEFTDTDGRTVALVTLRADQIIHRVG
ncbi:DUF4926 domain-containing protein [Micromonospora sp. NPDC049047]|uniref:DUF4926 domain-containing protein n=1 Tax=Micromonospora sp. NPDC049047 TaxID=3155645 RepID=UPI0034073284